jgi:hypothetical protein
MHNLPKELIDLIYEFDPTKRIHFDDVVREIKLNSKIEPIEEFVYYFYGRERIYEETVKLKCLFNKFYKNRKELLFNQNDLIHMKTYISLSNPFSSLKVEQMTLNR